MKKIVSAAVAGFLAFASPAFAQSFTPGGGAGTGTVTSSLAGQLAWYALSGTTIVGNPNIIATNGSLWLGQSTSVIGKLVLFGNTSGAVTISPQAAAGTYNFNLPTTGGLAGQPLLSGGGGGVAISYGSLSGNTSTFATTSGSLTSGHCVAIDVSGNLFDSGNTCASTFVPGTNITTALNAALASQYDIQLPCGTFMISAKISFGLSTQHLHGCTREGTVLQAVAGIGSVNYLVETTFASTLMTDLTIDANSQANLSQGCANAIGAPLTQWIRVGCINLPNSNVSTAGGFSFISINTNPSTGSYRSLLRDCYVSNMQTSNGSYNGHAVEVSISNEVVISGCHFSQVDNGVNIAASNNVTVSDNVIIGNSAAVTGFPGVRCSNTSLQLTVTGNTIISVPRGIFLIGCQNSTVTGNSIKQTQDEAMLIQAVGGSNSSPTLSNVVSGNSIQDTCMSNLCSGAITLAASAGGVNTNNLIIGNNYISVGTPAVVTMLQLSGVAGGSNVCPDNLANITLGAC